MVSLSLLMCGDCMYRCMLSNWEVTLVCRELPLNQALSFFYPFHHFSQIQGNSWDRNSSSEGLLASLQNKALFSVESGL